MYRLLFRIFLSILVFAPFLISCEDVIQVNLQNASPRLVVEGRISNLSDTVKIMLHRSTDYFTPTGIIAENNAIVTIRDSRDSVISLPDQGEGTYAVINFHARPGDQFTLNINAGGVNYEANTQMPVLVKIDSLAVIRHPQREHESQLVLYIKDPPGIPNYYQVKVYRNDSLLNNGNRFALYSDKYFDGKSTTITVNSRRFGTGEFTAGDTIRVQLVNIDKMMFDYFQVLHDITDGGEFLSASTPSNPPNNVSNGALGYFTAWAVSERTVVVK
jgi:hypothetical protein